MSKRQEMILSLIKLKKNLEEIKDISKLNDRELIRVINALKSKGVNIENYFDSNSHSYNISHGVSNITKIKNDINEFSFLAISDTHLLSEYGSLNMIDKTYDFAVENDINYVFHMGDFVHGDNFSLIEFEKLLRDYPNDNNITTLLVMGNHDRIPISKFGINVSNIISANRCDIIPLHGNFKTINISDIYIEMCHKESKDFKDSIVSSNASIILKGHKHIYDVTPFINSDMKTGIMVTVPSLSKMVMKDRDNVLQNGMLKFKINLDNSNKKSTIIEQYDVSEKILKLGEVNYQFRKTK